MPAAMYLSTSQFCLMLSPNSEITYRWSLVAVSIVVLAKLTINTASMFIAKALGIPSASTILAPPSAKVGSVGTVA